MTRGRNIAAEVPEMWKCRGCGLEVLFRAAEPELDEAGCYFLCPGCGHRNPLVNVATPGDDAIALGQPND